MNIINSCYGRRRGGGYGDWYHPKNVLPEKITYCKFCVDNSLVNNIEIEKKYLYRCNCDAFNEKYYLESNKFYLSIIDSKNGTPYPLLLNKEANINGVMHVDLPTCTKYNISISNTDDELYYTIESAYIGNKKIIINNEKEIYYSPNSDFEIEGFKTGADGKFLFISPSKKDLDDGRQFDGLNESNVITLTLQKRRRISKPQSYFIHNEYSEYKPSIKRTGINFDRAMGLQCSGFSGGATYSDIGYVNDVKTSITKDKFECVGDKINIMIQLISSQDDDTKYSINYNHFVTKKITKLDEEIRKKQVRLTDINDAINKLKNELECIEDECKLLQEEKNKIITPKKIIDQKNFLIKL
jgi:hypothetical protein